ncbi:hypothetical protein [Cognatilysobacter terrigena]|uniref:hypothetical protein n=1 Tax=Cognatilysobacter terrigena TaxID=2488749 RepID=UPI001FEB92E1|nr:hypothetical protein [Lysobacter terrigena]
MRLYTLLRLSDLLGRAERPARGVFRAVIEPRKPRHRLLRVVLALFGLALLAAFLVVAVAVGAVMIIGGLGWKLLHRTPRAPRDPRVLDGTYRVVTRPLLSR